MKASRAESNGEATIVLHLKPDEEESLKKLIHFALSTSFTRLEEEHDMVLDDHEHDTAANVFCALWPNAVKGHF